MSDKLLLEAIGWKEVAVDDLTELQPYTRYAQEKNGTCTVRFPDGTIVYNFSPSTNDHDALDWLKACSLEWELDRVSNPNTGVGAPLWFYRLSLWDKDGIQIDVGKNECDFSEGEEIYIAFREALTEDVPIQPSSGKYMCCKPRIKPALLAILEGDANK